MILRKLQNLAALSVLAFGIPTLGQAKAHDGGWTSGGGDDVALEFVSYAYRFQEILEVESRRRSPEFKDVLSHTSPRSLKSLLASTKVHSQETLFLEGREVSAINYPSQKLIEVSRSRWKTASAHQKLMLAAHEVLGLSFRDARYELSAPITKRLMQENLSGIEVFTIRCLADTPLTLEYGGKDIHIARPTFYIFNLSEHIAWIKLEDNFREIAHPDLEGESIGAEKALRHATNCGEYCDPTRPDLLNEEFLWGGPGGSISLELWESPSGHITHLASAIFNKNRPETWESNLSCTREPTGSER